MAVAYRARCIVLKKTKLGEADIICTMLAEDGHQIRAVAKGLRKPGSRFGARLEPFSVVDCLLHPGKSLDIVREVRCEQTNARVRSGFARPYAAMAIAEFVEKLSRDGALVGERVFPLTVAAIETLGACDEGQVGLIVAAHLMKAMAMQGFTPAVRECASCGRELEQASHFNISAGGALCDECAGDAFRYDDSAASATYWVATLLYTTFADLVLIGDAPVSQLLDISESWTREHLSLNLRGVPFLKSLL